MPVTVCAPAKRMLSIKSQQTRMIKNSKFKRQVGIVVLQKVREQGIRFWDDIGMPKVGIKLSKLSHARMFSDPKNRIPFSLTFCSTTIPTCL